MRSKEMINRYSTPESRKKYMVDQGCTPLDYDILFFRLPHDMGKSRIYHVCSQDEIDKSDIYIVGTVYRGFCSICRQKIEKYKKYLMIQRLDAWSRG